MPYPQPHPYLGIYDQAMSNNHQAISNNHQSVVYFTARVPTFSPFNSASEHDNRKRVKAIRLALNRPGSPFHKGSDCRYHACLYLLIEGNHLESPRWMQINMTQKGGNGTASCLWIQWCTVAPPPPSHPLDALDILAAPACTVGNVTDLICREHGTWQFKPNGEGCWEWVLCVIYNLENRGFLPSSPSSYGRVFGFLEARSAVYQLGQKTGGIFA